MPRLDLVFAEVTQKNVEQLRLMNELIFPVRYNDQFYKDVYKNQKLAQFGASTPSVPLVHFRSLFASAASHSSALSAARLNSASHSRWCGRPIQ